MILVAVGSNLPDEAGAAPVENCERALRLMAGEGVEIVARSRWYRSAPVPRSAQPDYVNGVVRVATGATPDALLGRLHAIEAAFGRVRGARNAARVIDLDLLAFDGLVREDGDGGLRLPHPRLHERAFVLLPLRDVAPGWRHPVSGRSVERLIAELADEQDCALIEA